MASQTYAALSVFVTRFILRDRSWHLRVRRFADDPTGPVLHHEVAVNAEVAKQRLVVLRDAIESERRRWEKGG